VVETRGDGRADVTDGGAKLAEVDSHATADSGLCRADAGVTEVIQVEGCYLGWQESLLLMAQLVEAEIPG